MSAERSSLSLARSLEAPSALCRRQGDVENVEFWERHETLLEEARLELGPKHKYVYAPSRKECFTESIVSALGRPDAGRALRELAISTNATGVFALRLLRPSFSRDLQEELAHLRQSGIPLRRPNGMNRHGCILSNLGFQTGLLSRLGEVARPLGLALYPEALREDDINDFYGFSVRYSVDGDVNLAEHADAAALTLNVCLGDDFKGGHLLFRGVRFHDPDAETQPPQSVTHEPGVALIHLGQHLHAASTLTKGTRENIVLWATGRHGYVRIAPYDQQGNTARLL